jgi:ribosome-associated toxin RatA of RatAB toxin-antitoxin module
MTRNHARSLAVRLVALSLCAGLSLAGVRHALAQTPADASAAPVDASAAPADASTSALDATAPSASRRSLIFADTDAGAAQAGDAGPAATVTVSSEEVPGMSVRRGRSDTVIDAPMEIVARAVTDFPRYDSFMPHVRDVRVVHRNRADTDVYMQVPLRGSLGVVWALVRVNVRRTPNRLELVGHAVDGNMERFESTTVLERVPGPTPRTRMTFTLLALPRLPFPSSVFSREMVDAARTVANNLRARIARDLTDGG